MNLCQFLSWHSLVHTKVIWVWSPVLHLISMAPRQPSALPGNPYSQGHGSPLCCLLPSRASSLLLQGLSEQCLLHLPSAHLCPWENPGPKPSPICSSNPLEKALPSQTPLTPLCLWDSLCKNTGVGSPSLLQGIFLTQELNPCLLHWKEDSLHWATRAVIVQNAT